MSAPISNVRPEPDSVRVDIVDYVQRDRVNGALALETARYCLLDKFRANLARRFADKQRNAIVDVSLDPAHLEATPANEYVDLYVI